MKRRIAAMMLILTLIMGTLTVPAGVAEAPRYTASTPLEGASSGQVKNIERAVAAINGTKLEYGGRFSFNEIVGPRTKAQGYVAAENARGVSVTGGGVAQVATTLYLALLRLGDKVEFTQLSTYGQRFEGNYVSDGSMAVITDYSGGTDFAFVNRAGEMTIELWASSSALNCVITLAEGSATAVNWFGDAPITAAPTRTVSASITCGGGDGALENVRLAAKSVNGTRLNSGDTFSFNKVVGARTKHRGYVGGVNGRGVKVTGGGVAQVASAIWLAIKQMDDIAIVEKSTYGKKYNQKYVKSSADAIVTDYNSKKDFSFKYKGAGSIVIYTTLDGNTLTCNIAYE